MKTIGDLIEACGKGMKPVLKVIGYVWDEFELDEQCLLRITAYAGTEDGAHHFQYNFDEFKDYNRKFLKSEWYMPGGLKGTAEEAGEWNRTNIGLYLGEKTTDLLASSGLEFHTDQSNREIINIEIARLEKELQQQKDLLAQLPDPEPEEE